MSFQVGDYITNNWSGHAYYGQTGQIYSINPSTGGAQIDWDGDGLPESGGGVNINSSNITAKLGSEYEMQNGISSIETFADGAIVVAILIGAVVYGWVMAKVLIR